MDRGFDVYDMAYPYDSTNAAREAARGRMRLQQRAQRRPAPVRREPRLLRDGAAARHATRSARPNALETTTTLADMKAMVTNAENSGGGWVPLEIHDICDGPGDPLLPAGAPCYAPGMVTRALFNQFLDWVKGEVDAGRVQVKTVHEVVGGALQPQTPIAPAPVRTGNLLAESVVRAVRHGQHAGRLLGQHQQRPRPPARHHEHERRARGHEGPRDQRPGQLRQLGVQHDRARCSTWRSARRPRFPATTTRSRGWYKGNGQIKIVAYWRNADNFWQRISWGPGGSATFPAAANWTNASFSFAAPAGATAVSAGFYVDGTSVIQMGGNSYTIDDTSLVDDDAAVYTLSVSSARRRQRHGDEQPGGHRLRRHLRRRLHGRHERDADGCGRGGLGLHRLERRLHRRRHHLHRRDEPARSATATFALLPVQLSVATAGAGAGSVTSPAGIDCGATCRSRSPTARASRSRPPPRGLDLHRLERRLHRHRDTCTVAMNAAQVRHGDVHAAPGAAHRRQGGHGRRPVTSSPAGIDCGATCQVTVRRRHERHAHRDPARRLDLHRLERRLHGRRATCVVSMHAAKRSTATFTHPAPTTSRWPRPAPAAARSRAARPASTAARPAPRRSPTARTSR